MDEIRGTRTSVYVGSFSNDHNMSNKDLGQYPKYFITGSGNAILSNRISYFFDLHGPSVTVDTACSSSLVCFHMGNQSLRNRESDIAIVAGSALHFDPSIFITMTDFDMLSTDGRCRTFDANGSGYVRGEGIAAVVLKRRSTALLAADNIRAVVRGSGVNHDGTKSGLTLPNGAAQASLIRDTYKAAGVPLSETGFFEAHGTGTPAGDPIEAKAIGSVFAEKRETPLLVGSIKSNVGHLEGASGLAGIIKATLSVEAGKVFPNMHFNTPNPKIDFKGLKIEVPTELRDWPLTTTDVRRASINSFGYGGTNAHVILENYHHQPENTSPLEVASTKRPYLVALTSHNDKAAQNVVGKLSNYLQSHPRLDPGTFAYSLSVRRTMHQLRSFAIGHDHESLLQSIQESLATPWNSSTKDGPRVGFVFTGQGAQWHAMGRQLLDQSPLFRQTIERCDTVLKSLPDGPEWSCLSELYKSKEDSRVSQSLISQPLCAAVQLALVDILRAWDITPSAVVGHSSGEIAAAYAAGILTFENAIICAYYRGLYMSQGKTSDPSQKRGTMMAVGMTEIEGQSELEPYEGRIALAAVNSPSSLTLSGDEDAILELKGKLEERKVFVRQLQVEQAFHSHHMYPLAPGFERALAGISDFSPSKAHCRMVSSVTARNSSARPMDSAYWAANMTGVVRFSDALTGILLDEGDEQAIDVLVEIGAHPALRGPARQVTKGLKIELPYIATLQRDKEAFDSLLATAGELFSLGFPVDLKAVNSDHAISRKGTVAIQSYSGILRDLPSFAWDHHNKHWAETRIIRENRLRTNRHTILGAPIAGGVGNHPRWRSYLRLDEIPWLAHHFVGGKVLFPAAGYISMALEAISTIFSDVQRFDLRDVMFKNALVLGSGEEGTEVIFDLQPLATSAKSFSSIWYRFSIYSFDDAGQTLEHCHGQISVLHGAAGPVEKLAQASSLEAWRGKSGRREATDQYYAHLQSKGLDYGECFALLGGDIESGEGFAVSQLDFDPSKVITTESDVCIVHPTILDAAFHVIFAAMETRAGKKLNEAFVPTFINSASVSGIFAQQKHETAVQSFWAKSETTMPGPRISVNQVSVQSKESNNCLLKLNGLELTAIGSDSVDEERKSEIFFRLRWQPLFSRLGSASPVPQITGLADLVDLFAHETPDAVILHLTSKPELVNEALQHVGGAGEQRRIRSITPCSLQSLDVDWSSVSSRWPGIASVQSPQNGLYDLVLVNEASGAEVASYVKPGGLLITETTASTTSFAELQKRFDIGQYTCWQSSKVEDGVEDLTVVVSSTPSDLTKSIASAIVKAYKGDAVIVPFTEPVSSSSVVSLVSLDHDLLFDPSRPDEAGNLHAMQQLVSGPTTNTVWVLRGATLDTPSPSQAVMVGLIRTLRNEHDEVRLATLDFPLQATKKQIVDRALEVLTQCTGEDELAVRGDCLLVPRIERDITLNEKLPVAANRQPRLEKFRGEGRNLSLTIGKTGLLDTLAFEDDADVINPELGPDEIELEVRASALNFRDIAASIGIIDDYRLGDEASGVVLRLGSNVDKSKFAVGDRILAIRPGQGAHRSIIRNPAMLCHPIGNMDFVTAASIEAVLLTAYYSLIVVGQLQKGEYCLIHSAAGGVGQMAIQLAQQAGAHVIATVGSAEKRAYLHEQFGLEEDMMLSSRDGSFEQGVMRITGGRGCDLALNSLAGELLHATWRSLAPFGRMIEIGKRDIHEKTALSMAPFRRNVTYASVDLITMFEFNRPLLAKLMAESFRLVNDGEIRPPGPVRVFGYSQVQTAFRTLQIGKFFGKIVLVPKDDELVPTLPPSFTPGALFKPNRSYLLVGGLGGIGRALAEWMYRRGARHLGFLSRSGKESSAAQTTIDWLTQKDVRVSIFKGDVTNQQDVQRCVRELGPQLAGIFQAAMVLRDVPFAQMTEADWSACVLPKTVGARNLHEATKELDLDFFVCFSSSSSVVGAVGQANYAAANAYLDALMRHRRELRLAGSTMNVGVVHGVGVVAEDAAMSQILERLGYASITEEELFYQIQNAVESSRGATTTTRHVDAHQVVTGVNIARKDVYWASKPLFRNLYSNLDLGEANRSNGVRNLMAELRAASDAETRVELITEAFIAKVAAVLSRDAETIQAKNPLSSYGLDSIVAVEFRRWFSKTLSIDIALFDILGATSIEVLVRKVSELVKLDAGAESKANTATPADQALLAKRKGAVPVQTLGFPSITLPAQVPLSTYQTRIWFLHNLLPDASSLNFAVTARLNGQPRLNLVQETLKEIVYRNDILRTRYFEGEEFTEQQVLDSYRVEVAYEELDAAEDSDAAFDAAILVMQTSPMDIEEGEVMRVKMCKLSSGLYAIGFVFHHIAIDNGSSKSFVEQFIRLYDALSIDSRAIVSVPSPAVSYGKFSVWNNNMLESPESHAHIAWWKKTLGEAHGPSALLPFAKGSRKLERSGERHTVQDMVPIALIKRMKRLASQAAATPFHFVMAAFRAFVHRYTGEDDLTLLMIDGNRPHVEVADVLGFFVNMIPLRLQGHCDSTFEQLLQHARGVALDAISHSASPFDQIVNAIGAERTSSYFPIGQIAINYQVFGKPPTYPSVDFDLEDIRTEDIPTACDLALEALEDPSKGLDLKLQYDPSLYSKDEMERFLQNFVAFMSSVIKDHRQPIEEIDMVGPKELAHLRSNCWNLEPTINHWKDRSIISRVLTLAELHPNAVAIESSDGKTITYEGLINRALAISQKIREAGAFPGDIIGIMLQPSVDLIATMIGICHARCGYVALEHEFAKDRLHHMILDTSVNITVTSGDLVDRISEVGTSAMRTIVLSDDLAKPDTWTFEDMVPTYPFYVIYTSVSHSCRNIGSNANTRVKTQGSSGKPKGVILTHANTQAMLSSHNAFHDLSPRDRVLFHSSPAFDLSVVQIWGALTSGATILLADQNVRIDPEALANFMKQGRVTTTYFPATQFALLMEHNRSALEQCTEYRRAIFAGEYLPVRLVKAIYTLKTPVTVFNQWGPSETTVQTSSHMTSLPDALDVNLPIGYPLPNNSHYVLDKCFQPVPASVVGELFIGGAQVGRGYIGQPQLTSRNWLSDPFASEGFLERGWKTMYKTGDKGRFLSNGQLDFKGRISGDRQIKLRGFRIDLAEVENEIYVAAEHNLTQFKFSDIAVLPRSQETEGEQLIDQRQLVAFIVLSKPSSFAERQKIASTLHSVIRLHLNNYMLPSGYHFTDSLSNLPSGKIGRQNLLAMKLDLIYPQQQIDSEVSGKSSYEADQVLESVISAFKIVLKLGPTQVVKATDSFFDLGGQSLLLLRLQSALQRQFKIKLHLKSLIGNPTALGIAAIVGSLSGIDMNNIEEVAIDWEKEAVIPNEAAYQPASNNALLPRKDMTEVLLTGVETPSGINMLLQLLSTRPQTRITVMGTHEPVELEKLLYLIAAIDRSFSLSLLTRVRILSDSSLASPNLGLTKEAFGSLGRSLHAIYHFGSSVSLIKPYADLRRVNVDAVHDVIRLAALNPTHRTEIHYLSTWSVPHLQSWKQSTRSQPEIVKQEVAPNHFVPSRYVKSAYFQTKWVAEMLLSEAAKRGIPATIYRGAALGASNSDVSFEDNFTVALVRAAVQSGEVPDLGAHGIDVDVIPVDYLIRAIARLSSNDAARSQGNNGPAVFHIKNPFAQDIKKAVGRVSGKEPKTVPVSEWLARRIKEDEIVGAVLGEYLEAGHRMFSLDDEKTRGVLSRIGWTAGDEVDWDGYLVKLVGEVSKS
jgi:amino acid adenylation domain-containing protein